MTDGPDTAPGAAIAHLAGSGISLTAVRKRYGETTVLDDIDLSVRAGQRIALIGPSGSGKTTILRTVAMLEPIEAGSIRVEGVEINGPHVKAHARSLGPIRRKVGMVFQQFNLFPNLTVLDNITLAPRRVLKLDRARAEAEARELLASVGLAEKAGSRPHQLSGGQQQRVAIARSLAMRPSVLLFDEVTSALDPELVAEVLSVIRGLAERSSVTMLIVTHEMRFAGDVADEVVFMEAGRIIEQGPPGQVLGDPQNGRTRQFLSRLSEH
ncbi:amino acid ABC transporter ATP-binding protein [Dactylosporangium sp. NPDC048998]|uniref:amino acid ABC transporter ATP-binding protein n=1 Tax=Dactylosporangium sp. NPDC048998 TaxID=3363976 RepID=UPI0037131A2D